MAKYSSDTAAIVLLKITAP